ncbi:hypothetical protein [Mucilaginibacter sp.]|uniref:hypothetical protein n=1 Tax=Mucilaginibacter sp. TaxID=1882438 RepID=UPI002626B302|nr:hypothetical protein [Mucilaginibacter sp.]MDB5030204.1 hypothetical protein [Mucilaginibacter sp.]
MKQNATTYSPHYFFLDEKVTKNQVSKEASLRTGPLPCKSGKTTGCIILLSRKGHSPGKKTLCPSPHSWPAVLPAFSRSLFADTLLNKPKMCVSKKNEKRVKACQHTRPGVWPVKWQRLADLIFWFFFI